MINRVFKSTWFPISFQILFTAILVLLVLGGLGISTEDATLAKQLRNTNLSNLIVWSYWWPVIIISAIIIGRVWCTICPVELISAITAKFGLKLKAPKFIKSGWIITILYAAIVVIAVHTLAIHRQPHRMAVYLLALVGLSVVVSLVFEKRAFCSYFCPVGKLLGLYSLLSRWGIRVKSTDVCASCKTKDCITKQNYYKLIERSCTSDIYLPKIEAQHDCILCSQCFKSCPNDNIEISKKIKNNGIKLSGAEIGLISILLGFVGYEILSTWNQSKQFILTPATKLYNTEWFSFLPEGTFSALILFIVLPLMLLLVLAYINSYATKTSLTTSLSRLSLSLLPIIAAGHIFKSLIKMSSRIPYLKYAVAEPDGVNYAQKIVDKSVVLINQNTLDTTIVIVGMLLLFAALIWSIRKVWINTYPLFSKILFSGTIMVYWLFLDYGPVSFF